MTIKTTLFSAVLALVFAVPTLGGMVFAQQQVPTFGGSINDPAPSQDSTTDANSTPTFGGTIAPTQTGAAAQPTDSGSTQSGTQYDANGNPVFNNTITPIQTTTGSNAPIGGAQVQTQSGGQPETQTGGQQTSGGLQNPLNGVNSLGDFFYMIANFAYSLSYAVIAFFLIWSGFKFVVAQGNEEKLNDAKKTFYYTIIGAVLLIGANVITEVVRTVINQFSKTQV